MSLPKASLGAITMFVINVEEAKAWYAKVFNAPIVYEDDVSVAFAFENTTINLLNISEGAGLVAPRSAATPSVDSHTQLTIWSEDTNAVIAGLAELGIPLLSGPIDRPWGMRTATISDPDGHVWEIAQQLQ